MNKKILLIIAFVFLSLFIFAACGGSDKDTDTKTDTTANTSSDKNDKETETDTNTDTENESTETEYTVKVVNFKGEPITSGVFVQLLKDGEEIGGMKKTNANGEVTTTLDGDNYTFELIYTDEGVIYDESECVLSKNAPTKEVMLYNEATDRKMTIVPYNAKEGERFDYEAQFVKEGANKVAIDNQSYYLFQPTVGGVYKFSYICDVAITIGFFGQSGYVLEESTVEIKDRAFTTEVQNGDQYPIFVIGVKSLATDSCFLTVERIGDPTKEIQKLDYVPTQVPSKECEYNYLNADIVDLDVTDKNLNVVYSENDGFYHLGNEDGAIVLVRITSASRYIASFSKMCETTKLFKIFVDENGTPLREEVYNNMIEKYAEKCDLAGVVPLTKELEYAIKNILEQQGWYGEQNIFKYPDIVDENGDVIEGEKIEVPEKNAWLFACAYLVENEKGAEDSKIVIDDTIDPTAYHVNIDAGQTLYFVASKQRAATLTIKNAQGIKIKVNGVDTEYIADENGKIEIVLDLIPYVYEDEETKEIIEGTYPIEFSITNTNEQKLDISFTYVTKI